MYNVDEMMVECGLARRLQERKLHKSGSICSCDRQLWFAVSDCFVYPGKNIMRLFCSRGSVRSHLMAFENRLY